MTSQPKFSLTAPPPKVVLLPDSLFFTRAVPVSEGVTAAEVGPQVELALEGMAPFAVSQMYQGHFWRPGSKHALVFAAYRKRFTAEQTAEWADAEVVMPAFAAVVAGKGGRGMTVLLTSAEGLTAVHWVADDPVPSTVITRVVPAEATDDVRAELRGELLREIGGSLAVQDIEAAPAWDAEAGDGELAFKAGPLKAAFTREELDGLDVRDKDDLAARRRARSRDLLMWRVLLGAAAAIALAAVLEVTMIGAKFWQKGRVAQVNQRAPMVGDILRASERVARIEELSTRRLLPFEMMSLIWAHTPDSIYFTRTTMSSKAIHTLEVRAQTRVSSDMSVFRAALMALPACQDVRIDPQPENNGLTPFVLVVTFKPDAVKSEDASS